MRLVEKPREFISDLALVGIYMFDHIVFTPSTPSSPPGAASWRSPMPSSTWWRRITSCDPTSTSGWWFDTGKREDMLESTPRFWRTFELALRGHARRRVGRSTGRVVIEKGAEIVGSVVRGPAIIGERTRIVNSYIGPFTSIYHDCLVSNSEVEHSIVMENCRLLDLPQPAGGQPDRPQRRAQPLAG